MVALINYLLTYAATRCYIISDNTAVIVSLLCTTMYQDDGCSGNKLLGVADGQVCYCNTDLCNGVEPVMTSSTQSSEMTYTVSVGALNSTQSSQSFGHVIDTVALVIGVLIGHGL